MRFREIMEQLEFHKDHQDAMPGVIGSGSEGDPDGPSNFYHKYRLGLACAGSPENMESVTTVGPANDKMVMIGYTDVDVEIYDRAHKKMGYKYKKLTSTGSKEHESIQKVSPVPKRKKNRYGI